MQQLGLEGSRLLQIEVPAGRLRPTEGASIGAPRSLGESPQGSTLLDPQDAWPLDQVLDAAASRLPQAAAWVIASSGPWMVNGAWSAARAKVAQSRSLVGIRIAQDCSLIGVALPQPPSFSCNC